MMKKVIKRDSNRVTPAMIKQRIFEREQEQICISTRDILTDIDEKSYDSFEDLVRYTKRYLSKIPHIAFDQVDKNKISVSFILKGYEMMYEVILYERFAMCFRTNELINKHTKNPIVIDNIDSYVYL